MDTETQQLLAALLSQAKSGNKNLGSLLGNLDSPILAAMAGVLDPYYGSGQMGGGGNSLYGSFAGDETTPAAVKAVMDWVDQGMNSYQIEAQINSLDPNIIKDSGYTDAQLISMGKDMSKEGGKRGTDVFAKAGLRNPNEIYSLEDVPMNQSVMKMLADQQTRKSAFDKNTASSKQGFSDIEKRYKTLLKQITNQGGSKIGAEEYNSRVAEQKKKAEDNPGIRERDMGASSVFYNTGLELTPYDGGPKVPYRSDEDVAPVYNPGKPKKTMDPYFRYEYEKAKQDRDAMEYAKMRFKALDEATRKGALRTVAEKGQTPFTDQVSTLLKFVSSTK
jgi:hypothetical protein